MEIFFKTYFTHRNNLFYMGLLGVSLNYSIWSGALAQHWIMGLIVLLISPFVEYYTHLYFLHLPMPKNKEKHPGYTLFMEHIHYRHHRDPKDIHYIFAQLWLTLPIYLAEMIICLWLTRTLEITAVFSTVVIAYYLFYEWSHWLAHSSYTPKNAYSCYMKKYHLWHHYKNEYFWYGITSPVADLVLGKYRDPKQVEKSLTVKNLTEPLMIEGEM